MEDQLRLFLLLGGTVFIIAVLAHGIWKIRKNSKPSDKERLEPRQWKDTDDDTDFQSDEQEGFDELGIGPVRVVGKDQSSASASSEHYANDEYSQHDESVEEDDEIAASQTSSREVSKDSDADEASRDGHHSNIASELTSEESQAKAPKLYGSVVTNPKPHMKGQTRASELSPGKVDNVSAFPEPPGFLLKEGEEQGSVHSSEHEAVSQNENTEASGQKSDDSVKHSSSDNDSASGQAHGHERSSGQSQNDRSTSEVSNGETKRAAQKFYVDPTIEEEPVSPRTPTRNEREIADFSLDAPEDTVSINDTQEESEQSKRFSRIKRNKSSVRRREEPNFGDDQMRIDFDTNEATSDYQQESFSANSSDDDSSEERAQDTAKAPSIEPEVLVLNVRTPEGEPIAGAALLPMLLTLGFKFGDQDIFHRHVNSNGKGPVLFSLANMFKPGVFDIDNLENFETQGISLFMILPIEGDPHQVFNMMHNAARKLADEFGAQVLDGRRSVLTKQGLQQYVEKIREFERKRMIARS